MISIKSILKSSYKKLAFTTLILCVTSQISAEKLTYNGAYYMSGLMTNLAQMTISTSTVKTSKKSFIHTSLEITTFSKWDNFFKMRDIYETFIDPTTQRSSMYKRNIYEGGYAKTEKYIFKSDKKTVTSTSKVGKRAEKTKNFNVNPNAIDIVAMMRKLRSIDFAKYKVGQTLAMSIIFDEKEFPVSIKYMGKETISAGCLGKKECFKLSISAQSAKLKGKDQNLVWLTTDAKRIPALIKFSIPVGVGQITIASVN